MQAILDRQNDVLQRLEELDKEAEDLRRELAENTITRNQLAGRVEELQAECSSLNAQLADYKVYNTVSGVQQDPNIIPMCSPYQQLQPKSSSASMKS